LDRLLVIDDDSDHLDVIVGALNRKGFDITSAPNGKAGLKALENSEYDLILTDLEMPEGFRHDHEMTCEIKTVCIMPVSNCQAR